jgi:hypothetical protein
MKILRDLSLVLFVSFFIFFLIFCVLENELGIKLEETIVEAVFNLMLVFAIFFIGSFIFCRFSDLRQEKKIWIREVRKY